MLPGTFLTMSVQSMSESTTAVAPLCWVVHAPASVPNFTQPKGPGQTPVGAGGGNRAHRGMSAGGPVIPSFVCK